MSDLESALSAQREAADAFKAAALRVSDTVWNVPRAPGKWSPAQVTDHVGLSTKLARDAVGERTTGGIPAFLRWLPRRFYFDKVMANGFPKVGRGPATFAPARAPAPRADLLARIDAEVEAFAGVTRELTRAGKTTFEHTFFGRIGVADYVMFNALHLDHHREQLPGGS